MPTYGLEARRPLCAVDSCWFIWLMIGTARHCRNAHMSEAAVEVVQGLLVVLAAECSLPAHL